MTPCIMCIANTAVLCEVSRHGCMRNIMQHIVHLSYTAMLVCALQSELRLCLQVLRSIAFLHSLDLIHSDLKPENILVKSYSRYAHTLTPVKQPVLLHRQSNSFDIHKERSCREVHRCYHCYANAPIMSYSMMTANMKLQALSTGVR